MTQEEKAKRYDEALERARNIHKDAVEMENSIITKTCEVIFPGLKEPEDERIRKNCIHFLELQKSHHASTVEIDECIAWLEKQGETSRQQRVEDAMQEVEEKTKIFTEAFQGKTSEEILAEMRGEQKPNKCEGCNNVKGCVACVDGSEWAHIEESEPAWSEWDENMVKETLAFIETVEDINNAKDGFLDVKMWIKSLKDRVGCEVNCTTTKEWSEEDENHIIGITQTIDCAIRHNLISQKTGEMQIAWLKSLQPQNTWKPSDEQIRALELVTEYWRPDDVHTNTLLWNIIDNLKKL